MRSHLLLPCLLAGAALAAPAGPDVAEIRLPDGGHYVGEIQDGLLHGPGRIDWPNGDRYAGAFNNGVMHGKGRFHSASGEVYDGEFTNGEFTGTGVYTHPDGHRHEGVFKDWQLAGEGVYIDPEGNRFEGSFADGNLNGTGRYLGVDGEVYEGEFEYSLYQGQGKLTLPAGDVFQGQFRYGTPHGEGTWTHASPEAGQEASVRGRWQGRQLMGSTANRERRLRLEQSIYAQHDLLVSALDRVAAGRPGEIELYLLAVAGDGTQEVFRREVEYVADQFGQLFQTGNRTITLINSRERLLTAPMATSTSISRSLQTLGDRMNEEDILFLFLTSHGSQDHELLLDQRGLSLASLPAAELQQMLKDSGIRHKVILVSACYSGGFIDSLLERDTMVITAARHDRASFGCADENDFVYFGRAFFAEALPHSSSFVSAFHEASDLVGRWESEQGIVLNSIPQMQAGPNILGHLAKWREQLATSGVSR